MQLLKTDSDSAIILIRLMVGAVFFSEGLQKFIFSSQLGSGRFEKIGIPNPDFFGPFVGTIEITCGALVLLGLFTRFAASPLILIMLTAILTTKVPILMNDGIWSMLHDSRTDWAMLLGSVFLFFRGGGKWSLDNLFFNAKANSRTN